MVSYCSMDQAWMLAMCPSPCLPPTDDFYGPSESGRQGSTGSQQQVPFTCREQQLLQMQMSELDALRNLQTQQRASRRQDRNNKGRKAAAPAAQQNNRPRPQQRWEPEQPPQPVAARPTPTALSKVPLPPLPLRSLPTKEGWMGDSLSEAATKSLDSLASADKGIDQMETLDSLPSIVFPPTPESTPTNSPRTYCHMSQSNMSQSQAGLYAKFMSPTIEEFESASVIFGATHHTPSHQVHSSAASVAGSDIGTYAHVQHNPADAAEAERLLEGLDAEEAEVREAAFEEVTAGAWSLATCVAGCRVVQQALSVATPAQQATLASQLRGQVLGAATCPNANHVLQRCIELAPDETLSFILEEMSGHVAATARHRYGCRVLERLIERALNVESLVDEVLADASQLCRHPFGNFVVQHVLKLGTPVQRRSIVEILHTDVARLARHRVSSHVVRCALANCSAEDRQRLIDALSVDDPGLTELAHHHCGSYVAREIRRAKGF